ncbi:MULTISPECIES: hypothetical protein [unclassified Microcoleus]|uniref:hypothetical protein n=1 Tax=unclassified Microcoleus TaxID=2642155 RepID=UPI002FD41A51
MKWAKSMFLDEKFKADDNRLNYDSYEELGLICGQCGELVFFKQGIERVSHFSHYKDTGKNKCRWRTKSHDSTQNTDSEAKKQRLEKFQKKIQDIIDEGIIKYQKISCSQLDDARHCKILLDRIDQGKSLVNQYKIDINLWLSRFYKEREHIQKFALSSYHNKSSEIQRLVFSNIVHYLCLPASENILGNILYYVFYLLNKEVALNNDFEEVRSKVIEIISFANWEKEYKLAKGLVDTSKFEQNAHSDFVNSPVEVKGFVHSNIKPKTSIINDDGSIAISKEVKSRTPKAPKTKLTNLSDVKLIAQNSLEWSGMIANVPCKVTLVNYKDHWQLEALPIKDIPSYPLLYFLANKAIEGYWQEKEVFNLIIEPINNELSRLDGLAATSQDPKKIEKIGIREAKLQKLKSSVLSRQKLNNNVLAECTELVKKGIENADYRPSTTDLYFSRYVLGQVYFLSQVDDSITYLLDDFMSHKRIPTKVSSAVEWLNLVPSNLKNQFPKQKPTLKELQGYLYPKFNAKFPGVELKIREENKKIFLDIIYEEKIQVTQLLTAKMPATDEKNPGKVSTKVATTLNFSQRSVFEKFLRVRDGRFVAEAQNQLRHLVNIFLSRNFSTLVGENKVGKQKKVAEIIGLERSKQSWSAIKNNFVKYLIPFSADSAVDKGKLIWLNTGKPLSIQDLENLVISIGENWSNWSKKNEEYIQVGSNQVLNTNPERLAYVFTAKTLTGTPEVDRVAWKHTLDWMCEITKLPIGFRASNGVILTPDALYDSHVDKWMYRIKIQLIDILLDSKAGNIEAWLQKSPEYLYDTIRKLNPNWKSTTSKDILKHLEAMHDALNIGLKVESSLQ